MKDMAIPLSIAVMLLASAVSMAATKREILSISGLQEGEYRLKKGPAACASGDIEVVGEEGDLSLKVGPHILVDRLDESHTEESERGCSYTMQASVRKGEITGAKREVCKGKKPVTYATTIRIKGERVTLIKKNTNGKTTRYTCEYELIKDQVTQTRTLVSYTALVAF